MLVSVVMPVFNSEKYVGAAMASVLRQTHADLELLVVDDGSQDATHAVAEGIAAADGRARVLRRANSGRPSIPRNQGIREARGELVAFIDGDDLFEPGKIARQVDVFRKRPEVDLVFGDFGVVDAEGRQTIPAHLRAAGFLDSVRPEIAATDGDAHLFLPSIYRALSTTSLGATHTLTVMVRRSALGAEPEWFPERMVTHEDLDLWLRIALRGRVAFVDDVLGHYRRHGGNITGDKRMMALGAIALIERNLARGGGRLAPEDLAWLRRKASACHYEAGYCEQEQGSLAAARRSYARSLILSPDARKAAALGKSLVPGPLRAVLRSVGAVRRGSAP